MSSTKTKYDLCSSNQQKSSNKSIFDYIVDKSRFVNNNECNNYTAPFLTYIPSGIPNRNVDIENDLKGMSRITSKCVDCKYKPENLEQVYLTQSDNSISPQQPLKDDNQPSLFKGPLYNYYPNNKKECPPEYDILPNKYLSRTLPK